LGIVVGGEWLDVDIVWAIDVKFDSDIGRKDEIGV